MLGSPIYRLVLSCHKLLSNCQRSQPITVFYMRAVWNRTLVLITDNVTPKNLVRPLTTLYCCRTDICNYLGGHTKIL